MESTKGFPQHLAKKKARFSRVLDTQIHIPIPQPHPRTPPPPPVDIVQIATYTLTPTDDPPADMV